MSDENGIPRVPDDYCPRCDMHVKDCVCHDDWVSVVGRADRMMGRYDTDAAVLYESRD